MWTETRTLRQRPILAKGALFVKKQLQTFL